MSRIRALLSTTAARLSALYLLLFMVCALALVFYMTGQAARVLRTQTQTAINEEVQDLAQVYQRTGLGGLVRAIDRRSRVPGANLYLITDKAGVVLAGNVADIDPEILLKEGWIQEPFEYLRFENDSVEPTHYALAHVFLLPNKMRILVGRDLGEPERFRAIVQRSLTLALGMMGFGALLIWYFVGRHALKRIDGVSVASQRIMAGDLTGRLPVTGSGDEFDRLSENLNQMLGKIADLNEGLKQVSDNIAHDLKTPLTRLRNRAEAALATRQSTGGYKAALEDMIGQSDQLIRTFNAILMISRLEAGYSSERMAEVDLASLASDVVELYEPLAEEAGTTLFFKADGPQKIQGNRELLSQTLSNIIDNAIKYGSGVKEPKISVTVSTEGKVPVVTISDNGPGVADADRERVTERFVRLEKSRSLPGSGLGLSLAKAVMKLHKGDLRLGSDGQGLKVSLVFNASGATA
ncbi:MAG: HAMP domain-containing sensor histidine kinase [Rhizobiaceae bacterium]